MITISRVAMVGFLATSVIQPMSCNNQNNSGNQQQNMKSAKNLLGKKKTNASYEQADGQQTVMVLFITMV